MTLHNEDGDIHTKDIHFNQANIQNDNGDIQMKQLDPDIPLRIKNEEGDINLNYKKNFITPKSSLVMKKGKQTSIIVCYIIVKLKMEIIK